jgi:hypothetical protein
VGKPRGPDSVVTAILHDGPACGWPYNCPGGPRAQGRALHPDVARRCRRSPRTVLHTGSGARPTTEFDSVMDDNEAKVIGAQDAVLLGRHMYDEWSRYWPTADEQPFADFINSVKKYVLTSTPLANGWHNAEAVEGPIEDLVRDLTARPGGRHRRSRQHRADTVAARGGTRRRTAAGGRSSVWIHRAPAVREGRRCPSA